MKKFNLEKDICYLLSLLFSVFFSFVVYFFSKGSIDFILICILSYTLFGWLYLIIDIDEIKKMLYKERGE